jgi:hypothetical protein
MGTPCGPGPPRRRRRCSAAADPRPASTVRACTCRPSRRGLRRALGDEDPVRPGREPRHEREVAAVAPHDLDDERALVARGGRVQRVDRLGDAVQRGVGTDGHVGAEHVVVDRADEADQTQVRVGVGGVLLELAGLDELVEQLRPLAGGRFAPVRLPSPPITTSASMPARRGCAARAPALPGPELLRAGGADHGATLLQDAADVVELAATIASPPSTMPT